VLYVGDKKRITLGERGDHWSANQRVVYELTDAISLKTGARALEMMDAILNTAM